ncbi:unnamed protein product [Haemonchus placei]|uniref:EGF-like domain-containing protein n=1 Tax=Haemonchus placei TaxID=6290 RepID=A0A0N4XB31_HAEPC|nr:unnamed protein product [Haemonchus placei]
MNCRIFYTVFTWGEYDVLYVAQDNASNTAECSFKVHVSREHCPQLEEPVNGVQACESWGPQLRYKACSIECRDGYEFSRPPAIFYTCAADGMWRPRLRNQLIFRYPQCTKSVPATRVMLMRVSYPGSSPCSEASRDALRMRLLASIHSINQKWDICSLTDINGCVGARVDVGCSDDFARSRRESPSFKVRVELPVKRDPVLNSVSGQKSKVVDVLQNEIINQGAFNLEKVLPNGRPDLTSFQLLDEFHCQSGQVTVDDVCDACTNYCLNDGVCKKNPVGYVECACKENFSGERCEVRFQPKSQRVAMITAGIGGIVAILVVIVIVIFMISFRFNRSEVDLAEKVQIDDLQQSNFLYGRPPIGDFLLI